MPLEHTEISIHGLRLGVKRWGRAGGAPVLALHGWLDNAASFDGLAPLLPELDLVALDLPGHGHSQHRAPGENYHFIDWVVVLFEAADALGFSRFSLLGHSMGAAVAALAAGAVPERIERLALLEGLGPFTRTDDEYPDRVRATLNGRARGELPAHLYRDASDAATRLRQVLTDLSQASAERLTARGTRTVKGGVVWRSDPRLRWPTPQSFNEGQVQAFLRRITADSLLVRARDGYPFDQGMLTRRVQSLPNLRVVEVEGGHHVHLEHPARVAPALRELFQLRG